MTIAHQQATESFLMYLDQWISELSLIRLKELTSNPEKVALVSVDVIKGFCNQGPLASPRVAEIVDPIVNLMQNAWELGITKMILCQDSHVLKAVEFSAWPPHCVRGTEESQTVEKIEQLPFFKNILVLEKNSIASGLIKGFHEWVLEHKEVDTYIVVGDCTDLCTYQLAMFLRLDANERQVKREVILPENCVQTYDMSVETAQQFGTFPHPGDFLHAVFLYHMALNGIKVVKQIE